MAQRSPKWAAKRREFIRRNPCCALCGCRIVRRLNVHHIDPFHLAPEKELVDSNLITLCEKSDAPLTKGLNCHQWAGHLGNWESVNPRIRQLCKKFAPIIAESRRHEPARTEKRTKLPESRPAGTAKPRIRTAIRSGR